MKIERYIVEIEMPDGDMASSTWICDTLQSESDIEDEGRWKVSIKEHWKPSEQDILLLERIANGKSNPQDFQASLGCLIWQLKKLREE